jgi:hypothetical protein
MSSLGSGGTSTAKELLSVGRIGGPVMVQTKRKHMCTSSTKNQLLANMKKTWTREKQLKETVQTWKREK